MCGPVVRLEKNSGIGELYLVREGKHPKGKERIKKQCKKVLTGLLHIIAPKEDYCKLYFTHSIKKKSKEEANAVLLLWSSYSGVN